MFDFILQADLRDTINDAPETRFITLDRGHIFTVETLDGHVDLKAFYETDENRSYLKPKSTPAGFQQCPTCPTCRGPIKSPRYNRVVKKALIDIQEQHAIQSFARKLRSYQSVVQDLDLEPLVRSVSAKLKELHLSKPLNLPAESRISSLLQLQPTDINGIDLSMFDADLSRVFNIEGRLYSLWRELAGPALRVANSLTGITNNARSPHVIAYEAAFTQVYWRERDVLLAQHVPPAQADRLALAMAEQQVGAPFPLGEARFKIEALLMSADVRLKLAPLAFEFADVIKRLPVVSKKKKINGIQQRSILSQSFNIMGLAIIRSCRRDADLAANLCIRSRAKRLSLQTELVALQSRFDYCRRVAQLHPMVSADSRTQNADNVMRERDEARKRALESMAEVLLGSWKDKQLQEWVDGTIRPAMESYLDDWIEFVESIRTGVFYQPVNRDEKLAIAKAVVAAGYGTAGRFYQCPNGHTFTIGECGQAMQEANCPDCGERIGGGHHDLLNTNRQDAEMDLLAMEGGALRNPHARY